MRSRLNFDASSAGTRLIDSGLVAAVPVDPDGDGIAFNGKPVLTNEEAAANLNRDGAMWAVKNGVITYTFADKAPNGQYNSPKNADSLGVTIQNFSPFTAEQRVATREAVKLWDDLVAIKFVEKNGAGADIVYMNTGEGGPAQAAAYTPFYGGGHGKFGKIQGDVFVNGDESSNFDVAPGGYGQTTLVHETGHAIGLDHPADYNFGDDNNGDGRPDPITYAGDAFFFQDSYQYTIMSYFHAGNTGSKGFVNWGTGGFAQTPQTPMLDDIAAAQRIYGVDTQTRLGDTTYGFNSTAGREVFDFSKNKNPYVTIYDAGGAHDKLDLSGFTVATVLDLRPGHFSTGYTNGVAAELNAIFGTNFTQATWDLIYAGGTRNPGFLSDNIGIAYNTIIEDGTTGTGNDVLIGNAVGNILDGGTGNDVYTGGAGADRFVIGQIGFADRITDFVSGVDKLDLSKIDANLGKGGEQAFRWVGTGVFSAAGDVRVGSNAAGNTVLSGDTNGDGVADFSVNLGFAAIVQADVVL
jgi:serralysin